MRRKAVVILGMHRSGTSTASGMLYILGLDLGKAVMGGNKTNSKGFFENSRIMLFNNDLFRKLHVNWHNTMSLREEWWRSDELQLEKEQMKMLILDDYHKARPLLFKDPRICVLLPLYLEVFEMMEIDPFFILTCRNPDEVAESLKKRDSFSHDKSVRIWTDHMLKAEKYSRNRSRMFIDYEDILSDPLASLGKIQSAVSLDLPLSQEVNEQIIHFVEPALNHFKRNDDTTPKENERNSNRIYDIFRQLTYRETTKEEQKELDLYWNEFYSSVGSRQWPKVTVITAVQNEPGPLEKTILSIVSQNYPNLEYLVVDFKSDFETRKILEKYKYLLSNLVSEPDDGWLAAMNKGLSLASGEWIIFLNPGDTFLHNGSIWELIKLLPEDCDVVVGDCISYEKISRDDLKSRFSDNLWKGRLLGMPSLFIRSSIAKKHPFNVKSKSLAALDLVLTIINEKIMIKKISYEIAFSHLNRELVTPLQFASERYAIIRSHQTLSLYQKVYHIIALIKSACFSQIRWIKSTTRLKNQASGKNIF